MYTVFYSLEKPDRLGQDRPKHKAYKHRAFQHLKGYKLKVAVSTICPVGFEALQSQKGLLNESDVLLLRVVICFKSPIGYNFTTDEILN